MSAKSNGFTLIELLIAITILAILSTIGMISFMEQRTKAYDSRRKQDLNHIKVALQAYYERNGHYPCTNSTVNDGWQTSESEGSWVNDICTSPIQSLSSDYINTMPVDPKDNLGDPTVQNGLGYFYNSSDSFKNCTNLKKRKLFYVNCRS